MFRLPFRSGIMAVMKKGDSRVTEAWIQDHVLSDLEKSLQF